MIVDVQGFIQSKMLGDPANKNAMLVVVVVVVVAVVVVWYVCFCNMGACL